jgi:hypothetical protein
MSAAKIVGRHLYRVKFSFVSDSFQLLLEGHLNITTDSRGLGPAGRAVMAVMRTAKFREIYPGAGVRDMTYLGTIDS